ncbi:hypothetical protein MKK67_01100 [Methylobacterium sp. J-072]|uniref:hypothetical protein n=1 Tax=Methylobacterium sp. J-072 TaxID=2836651 RepID=UPI001FB87195|nr:hypothetical protein [Methylobacterium sp. J-072]MCJ2091111.1 hypothetical protein [Methylobacterium sp. J-072]
MRFAVDPADIPAEKVARRLHLTIVQFETCKVRLFTRGFPRPDPDTGMYCLEAVDRWRLQRHPTLFPELTPPGRTATGAAPEKDLAAMAREAYERRAAGKAPLAAPARTRGVGRPKKHSSAID